MLKEIDKVLEKLDWMRKERIWPNGLRYLWTDAFGVVLLVSLHRELDDERYLQEAEWVVAEVERVLGRPQGIRIGEEPDRDGQYFHYLAMWMYALHRLGTIKGEYHGRAVELVRQIHPAFVLPGVGVVWKMLEDLSGPYPGYGLGGLDHFHGYVVYCEIDPVELAPEISDMKALVERSYRDLVITQDLGLGMMLWFTHLRANEPWARLQKKRCLDTLDRMWIESPGYFCREPSLRHVKFAFTNYGVSLGLQAVDTWPERVDKLNQFFDRYKSGDEYDRNAITHVMACTSHFPGEFIRRK
ncbi:MAG: hypothetical protein H6Q55_2582 [Deltaproteobacteria bacterium]|nr:hypothetical protein [Deltaproteobacteria bacterium]